ncbi:MAG: fructosamine kinase family protein [Gammaproteobacteria bacterium]|nr:fructosamine kinase family protein [Gammaproteobacteria bacterium]
MERELANAVAEAISAATGATFTARAREGVGGGCINDAWRLDGDGRSFFVKLNEPAREAMFAAEFAGLEELRAANAVRVPMPVCLGATGRAAFLVLEWLELGRGEGAGYELLGRRLADLHRVTRPSFGGSRDNTIGSTPQPNRADTDWVRFWGERRLGYQLELAAANGHRGRLLQRGEHLLAVLPIILAGHVPAPALLHGDLWSGNVAFTRGGEPVIFDPAVYYGDRETDLAMTELFGGFPATFHDAYREAWPLDPGYELRRTLYNLYHVLNHLNLFGAGYRAQAESMIDMLLGEVS